MEFVEGGARPRFLFRSRSSAPPPAPNPHPGAGAGAVAAGRIKIHKLHTAICFVSAALLLHGVYYFSSSDESQILTFLLAWTSLSLLVAPFAPPSLKGGDITVGNGDLLPPPPIPHPPPPISDQCDPGRKRAPGFQIRPPIPYPPPPSTIPVRAAMPEQLPEPEEADAGDGDAGESEWTDADLQTLRIQVSGHPPGEPGRWERIQEAFGSRHGVQSVIRAAKSMSERRPADGDAYQRFLKQRKPSGKAAAEDCSSVDGGGGVEEDSAAKETGESGSWSAGDDAALLNALKAFPKDASMRWEKVAAAVPGRTKNECMKRVAELKRNFRSYKASEA